MSYDPIDGGTGTSGGVKLVPYGEPLSNNSAARTDRQTLYLPNSLGSASAEGTALIPKRIPRPCRPELPGETGVRPSPA